MWHTWEDEKYIRHCSVKATWQTGLAKPFFVPRKNVNLANPKLISGNLLQYTDPTM
jgi:hypothetical protein